MSIMIENTNGHYIIFIRLRFPDGFEIETVAINNAISLTSGYNQEMKKNDAKYKVYLHQDTYILNTNFLFEVIKCIGEIP